MTVFATRFVLLVAIFILGVQPAFSGSHKAKRNNTKTTEAAQQRTGGNQGNANNQSRSGQDADNGLQEKDRSQQKSEQGNERSQEKQERREERKEIQEEYRGEREPGQEGRKDGGEPAKKPWYKFWE